MKRLIGWISAGGVLAGAAAAAVFLTLSSFDYTSPIEMQFAGACSPVSGIPGPEDLQIDPATRIAFISSLDRHQPKSGSERGAIYAFSLDDPLAEDAWRDRTGGVPEAFQPLGLHFYQAGDVRRLFVVNSATNAVEIYEVAGNGDLTHLDSVTERRLTSPNDVVGVGPLAFYVTNDVDPGRDSLLGKLHFLTRAGSGRLLYFDGTVWRVAADGLRFANGVAVSPSGERLYVAETSAAALRIYERNPETGGLRWSRTAPMPAAIDNINVDYAGSLWIAAHPRPLALARSRRNETAKAPSLVIRYDDIAGMAPTPDTVYSNGGEEISGSSAAARFGSTLLIGALLEKKFLICHLPA
ncbi:MAG: SMP-30/gluconolactonase/LRE family protein [Pseudomonadota bacterium]|nr:SMP-30/gluconolactonase/LRE family protein [Pseudomonadota bacterium]